MWLEQWDQTGAETMVPLLEPLSWAGSSRKQLSGTLEHQGVRPAQQSSHRSEIPTSLGGSPKALMFGSEECSLTALLERIINIK